MKQETKIEYLILKAANISPLVFKSFNNKDYNDSLYLLLEEKKALLHLKNFLEEIVKESKFYVEFLEQTLRKINDVDYAILLVMRKENDITPILSKDYKIEYLLLVKSNYIEFLNRASDLDKQEQNNILNELDEIFTQIKLMDEKYTSYLEIERQDLVNRFSYI